MTTLKPTTFQIEIVPYKRYLAVFFLPTWEQVAEFYVQNDIRLPDKSEIFREGLAACVTFEKGNWMLFINSTENLLPKVCHEVCHIVLNLFDFIGEERLRTADRNEPFCYLVENLSQRVLKGIFGKEDPLNPEVLWPANDR